MTKEELANEIAIGLIKTGVEGGFDNVCCSTAGDYPSLSLSSWEGSRADKLLKMIPGGSRYVGKSYSYIKYHGLLPSLKSLLGSPEGQKAAIEMLKQDCLMYIDALWEVATLDDTKATIYAGIWCPTSHNVVRRFLQKREALGYNLRSLETVNKLFYDQYSSAAGVPEYDAGYKNRAMKTYYYVKSLDLSKPSTMDFVQVELTKVEEENTMALKVFINPGHSPEGSSDPDCGASNANTGLLERDVARAVGDLMAKYLNDIGIETYVFQDPSLGGICEESNNWGADLFVSIHCNASAAGNARGTETWYYYGSSNGYNLAQCVQNQLLPAVYPDAGDQEHWNRGVREGGWAVIRGTDAPAILTELAFIDNDEDEAILANPAKQDEMARALARAITDYQSQYLE